MIRPATLSDCAAISAIFNEALLNTTSVYAYEPESLEDRQRWFNEKQEAGYPVLVDEQEGRVVGFATYGPFRTRPAYRYTAEHSVYVDVAWRNQGVGTGLLMAIIDEAKRQGIKTLVGGIDSANTDSRRFHTQHNFIYQGTIPQAGYKFGHWLDLCFYTLSLPGPDDPVER